MHDWWSNQENAKWKEWCGARADNNTSIPLSLWEQFYQLCTKVYYFPAKHNTENPPQNWNWNSSGNYKASPNDIKSFTRKIHYVKRKYAEKAVRKEWIARVDSGHEQKDTFYVYVEYKFLSERRTGVIVQCRHFSKHIILSTRPRIETKLDFCEAKHLMCATGGLLLYFT